MSDILEDCMAGMGCCDCDTNKAAFRMCGFEISKLRAEIARLQFTNAEREALISCIRDDEAATAYDRAATLRGLLERAGGKQ